MAGIAAAAAVAVAGVVVAAAVGVVVAVAVAAAVDFSTVAVTAFVGIAAVGRAVRPLVLHSREVLWLLLRDCAAAALLFAARLLWDRKGSLPRVCLAAVSWARVAW